MRSDYLVPASEIELETGLGKDLLRKWRQRYGFPHLETGTDGKIGYSRSSIQILLKIKRLLEGGFRPAQIVGKSPPELELLRRTIENEKSRIAISKETRRLLELLKKADMAAFESYLVKERGRASLSEFVLNTAVPLINEVGEAWSRNEIEIYHEHLCTSVIQRLLHAEVFLCKPKRGFPKILFATPPQELHALGLLMAEAVLAEHGAATFSLGSHTPLGDIKMAALAFSADVVALSFSFSFPTRSARPTLKHLRQLLPSDVEIWAGGSGLASIMHPPKGVRVFSNIQDSVAIMQNLAKQSRAKY